MKKYLVTIIIGIAIIVVGDLILGKALKHFYFKTTSGLLYRTTYSIDSTNADILIFGTSRANHHYDIKLFEDSTGLSAYNTGRDGNFIFYQTAVLKSILKRYQPKQIILDFTGTFEYKKGDYDRLSSLLPYYSNHEELRSIIELKSPFEKYKLISSIYPFNSLITNIAIGNLEFNKNRSNNKGAYKGFVPLKGIWNNEIDSIEIKEEYVIDEKKYKIVTEFMELCNRRNIPLIVVYSPVYYRYDKNYSIEICSEICKKNNVTFVDFSKDNDFLNDNKLFDDVVHLNKDGAKLLTKKTLKIIKNEG